MYRALAPVAAPVRFPLPCAAEPATAAFLRLLHGLLLIPISHWLKKGPLCSGGPFFMSSFRASLDAWSRGLSVESYGWMEPDPDD